MPEIPTWRLQSRPNGWWDRLYDGLRRRVNLGLVRFLIKQLDRRPPSRTHHERQTSVHADMGPVLEAGSGTAFATSLFQRMWSSPSKEARAICLDIDAQALSAARSRDPDLFAVVGDLRRMPFADETFELVFNSSTVEHLDDPAAAVMEMQRVCRPQGLVFVGVPYRFGPLGFQPWIRRTHIGTWLGPVFSRRTLDRLLRKGRLVPIAYRRYFLRFFIGAVAGKTTQPKLEGSKPPAIMAKRTVEMTTPIAQGGAASVGKSEPVEVGPC